MLRSEIVKAYCFPSPGFLEFFNVIIVLVASGDVADRIIFHQNQAQYEAAIRHDPPIVPASIQQALKQNVESRHQNRERSYMTETALLRNLTYIKNYKNSVI